MKPFVLDRETARRDLKAVEQELRAMKDVIRPRRGPSKLTVWSRNGHRVVRIRKGELLSYGRSLTKVEGQRYHYLKKQATILCTMLALTRGRRIHNSYLIHHPEGLLDVVANMRVYEAGATPVADSLPSVVEEAQVQTVQVLAGGAQ